MAAAALGIALIPRAGIASYTINNQKAPQVSPSPAGHSLLGELKRYQEEFKQRSRSVSLAMAIEAGLTSNPDLAAAYGLIQGSEWNLIAARRAWAPTLTLASGEATLLGENRRAATTTTTQAANPESLGTDKTYATRKFVSARGNLNWTFFSLPRTSTINANLNELQAQRYLFDVTARNLVLDIQSSYFQVQQQIKLVEDYEKIYTATLKQTQLTEARFNNGMVSILDVNQIRASLFSQLTTLVSTYSTLISTAAQLSQAMALPPGQLAKPSDPIQPYGIWSQSLVSTLQQARQQREEVKASLAQASSQAWRGSALFNQYWPVLSINAFGIGASSQNESGNGNGSSATISRSSTWDYGVGLGFSWSVFDGGINAASGESSLASERRFKAQAQRELLNIDQQVESAYAAYRSNKLAMASSYEQQKAALAAQIAAEARFAAGASDTTTVVQAITQAVQASTQYVNSVGNYNLAVAQLYRYSAEWPSGSLPLLQQRVKLLSDK